MDQSVKKLFILSIFLFTTFPVYSAPPSKHYNLPEIVAVQNRPYFVNKDLTFQIGLLPSDPFNKGITTGLTYTHYFKEYFGWEIVNINYNLNKETDLKKDINNINVEIQNKSLESKLDYITYYLATNIVYTPIYSKNLLFNDKVIHGEISFILGGGIANLQNNGAKPLVMSGCYLRFFSSPSHSWKFDFRNNVYIDKQGGVINAWSFGVGYSIQLGDKPTHNN